jgi:hypothetical protein
MKIRAIGSLAMKPVSQTPVIKPKTKDFQEIMQRPVKDIFTEIQEFQKSILNGKEFSGKDLIMYQIKTGQFSMRVELVSKVAEAAVSTVKKFQSPQ